MAAALRYVRFHIDKFDCECCGRMIKKGTIELSDGRRYGPQCSARARGIPRQPTAEVKRIEEEAARLAHRAARAAWDIAYLPAEWTWLAKGYGGNVGWARTDVYRCADGTHRAVVQADPNTCAVLTGAGVPILGVSRSGEVLVGLDQAQCDAIARSAGASIAWTTSRYAEWRFREGWTNA